MLKRSPIDQGHLFEGRELGRVLSSHTETFEKVASVRAEMVQSGTEPALPVETRARIFSIAHNALTNAFLHAHASRVEVGLDFTADGIKLSVSDDGIGLPDDYADRGRGFRGMRADAEQLGGRLIVKTGGREAGTTVTCGMRSKTPGTSRSLRWRPTESRRCGRRRALRPRSSSWM